MEKENKGVSHESMFPVLFYYGFLFLDITGLVGGSEGLNLGAFQSLWSTFYWLVLVPVCVWAVGIWFMSWVRENNRDREERELHPHDEDYHPRYSTSTSNPFS